MFLRKTGHDIPEKTYPHTEGDFSLKGLSFREKIAKARRDPRGIEVGTLVLIGVSVLAAAGIGFFIFNLVSDTGDTVDSASNNEIATYDANCDGQTVARIGIVLDPLDASSNVDIVFENDAAGYRQPTGTGQGVFNGTAATASVLSEEITPGSAFSPEGRFS